MHSTIVRTNEEVNLHLANLQKLIDAGVEPEINQALHSILYAFSVDSNADPNLIISKEIGEYSKLNLASKLIVDLCLWLVGKLVTAPCHNPLNEVQLSTEQVLDTFGKSNYTSFTLS